MKRSRPLPVRVTPRIARAAVARAVLGARQSIRLGDITLMPHQCDAVTRIHGALSELHVALLADDVGLGKTYVALAVARRYRHVRIIAPATLLPMWRVAVARADCANATVESLQGFSRSAPALGLAVAHAASHSVDHIDTLVIVDEAHHLRTANTKRYRAIAQVVSGADLLLMSATPIHNSPNDLKSLLALARGHVDAAISEESLSRVIVRRTVRTLRPREQRHPPTCMPHDPALLEAILALPAPLPAHDGAVAGALIRLGLLRAWCSSDAALLQSLTRRLLRGEALRHSLLSGRHPTTSELRSWLVGEQEVQLGFPELLVTQKAASGPLLDVLDRHLSAVRTLRDQQRFRVGGDRLRAIRLKEIMAAHSEIPVVAFSQFAETVRAIGRALSDIAGVAVVTGNHAHIASGRVSRAEVLASFAPRAQGRPPPPPHQRVRLLLTTDLLAEGVNIQDAGVVVHLDLPWTDALRRQRVGRLARVGSPHQVVHSYQFEPPHGAESVLCLHARLKAKARWTRQLIGDDPSRGEDPSDLREPAPSRSAAECASALRAVLQRWQRLDDASRESASDMDESGEIPAGDTRANSVFTPAASLVNSRPIVAVLASRMDAFLAVVDVNGVAQLVGGTRRVGIRVRDARYVLRTTPRAMLRIARAASVVGGMPYQTPNDGTNPWRQWHWPQVQRALHRWHARATMYESLGRDQHALSDVHHRAMAELTRVCAEIPKSRRVAVQSEVVDAEQMIERVRGAAGERAMQEWIAEARVRAPLMWLVAWREWPALCMSRPRLPSFVPSPSDTLSQRRPPSMPNTPQIRVVLLLVGDRGAPR